ncbi:MAG: alpha/beta hydrolase [Phycisphaerales bacterium]|nr:alpha/beta hydrolase [Phycisphaerales bacterium]
MDIETTDWVLKNGRGLELIGNSDRPAGDAHACVVFVHGFKGYKDYGFVPVLCRALARDGVVVHRFNLSCSGMTNDTETFARQDLFALDTWTRQVEDVRCVLDAVAEETLDGAGLARFVVGHSRGGATALMVAGREGTPELAGVATINAVDACCRMDAEAQRELLERGWMVSASARTGQELRINASWLEEQLEDPAAHDVLGMCTSLQLPALIMHGDADDAVDLNAGERIASAIGAELHVVSGANHVLNMSNPALESAGISPQLGEVIGLLTSFVKTNHGKAPI